MTAASPFPNPAPRAHTLGGFAREEVALANRNSGLPLEALRHDVTPAGLHYLLNHFDVPYVADAAAWRLDICGLVGRPLRLSLADLQRLPQRTIRVTLECAGNGRANFEPRWQSMPWTDGAVSTAEWTGTPLAPLLERAQVNASARDIVFSGIDRGFDLGTEHAFERSLTPERALADGLLLAWAMNGSPLPPQHGFPLRLVVPGWYGMASVKWLARIEAIDAPFAGPQQARTYKYRTGADDPGIPITAMRVKSLLVPPGIPDWYSRRRLVEAGRVELLGRAWAGAGTAIAKVEVGVDGDWRPARLDPPVGRWAWQSWRLDWEATPGEHEIACRATSDSGETQPLAAPWDSGGFGNNAVQRVAVTVR